MRFEDWDVLLFPLGSGTPIREFGASYFNVPDGNQNLAATPLLTSFVPMLDHGTPFQVSVHCWNRQAPLVSKWAGVDTEDELWQVSITIDRTCVATKEFGANTSWPQLIAFQEVRGQTGEKLLFPQFSAAVLSQAHWDARDGFGRIQVEINAGYMMEDAQASGGSRYIALEKIACYSFQPAPLEFLKRCSIAWPNASVRPFVYTNPFTAIHVRPVAVEPPPISHTISNGRALATLNTPVQKPQELHNEQQLANNALAGQTTTNPAVGRVVHNLAGGELPTVPYATPVVGGAYKFHPPHEVRDSLELPDGSSRCTSSYSAYGIEVLTAPNTDDHVVQDAAKKQQIQMRLPSDQIRQIIDALTPPKEDAVPPNITSIGQATMAPPPLPSHVLPSNDTGDTQIHPNTSAVQAEIARRIQSAMNTHLVDNRTQDRSSDVSMHATCNSFPTCISEDADGRLMHNGNPSTVVRGRKEGFVSPEARDFFSTTMGNHTRIPPPQTAHRQLPPPTLAPSNVPSSSPAELGTGKKRTRSALKALATGDGSPEKKAAKQPGKKPLRKKSKSESSTDVDKNDEQQKDEMVLDA